MTTPNAKRRERVYGSSDHQGQSRASLLKQLGLSDALDELLKATAPTHGGYPSTTAGSNGTSAGNITSGGINIPVSSGGQYGVNQYTGAAQLPVNSIGASSASSYTYTNPGPNWGTITIGDDGMFTISTSVPETTTIPEYSFSFTENGQSRKAVLAPEYDMTPIEGLKLTRLMYSAPNNLNKLEYVKANGLLRHFRLE